MDCSNDEPAALPAMPAITIKEGLQLFDQFLKSITEAVVEAEEDSSMKFRNRIAAQSRTIPIFLQSEGEEYGMNIDIYNCLMAFRKSKPHQFESMMTIGNFSIAGQSSYKTRKVVICVPDETRTSQSFVPLCFMEEKKVEIEIEVEVEIEEEKIGEKRKKKQGERGFGKNDFKSTRTAEAASKTLTTKLIEIIELTMKNSNNESNKIKTIEASIKAIKKKYKIQEHENNSENGIVDTAK